MLLAVSSLLGVLGFSGSALADENAASAATPTFSWLGYARGISRGWSASRDTPALAWLVAPHQIRMGGGELAILTWRLPSLTLRPGFAGFVELESDGVVSSNHDSGKILWRGSYALYGAVALEALGKKVCERCALEVTLQYRHESQHYTGSNAGDPGEDVQNQPYVGNDIILDSALSEQVGEWFFAQRAYGYLFLPNQSSYSAGAGIDLHLRFTRWKLLHPFVSLYGEYLAGTELEGRDFPDAHRLRTLFGVALPSWLGDVMLFGFADSGNRYGIRGLTNEATLGVGARLALGAPPSP